MGPQTVGQNRGEGGFGNAEFGLRIAELKPMKSPEPGGTTALCVVVTGDNARLLPGTPTTKYVANMAKLAKLMRPAESGKRMSDM